MRRITVKTGKHVKCAILGAMMLMLTACTGTDQSPGRTDDTIIVKEHGNDEASDTDTDASIDTSDYEIMENSNDGEHVISADGKEASYDHIKVIKSGDSEGDEADFYGENSAIFATNGATLDLSEIDVETDGTHANAVFSYGEGTAVNISDSVINTSGNCSGGLMTTGGGTMNATDLTIHTTGNSSAAIRSDRGGGTVNVTGGTYVTDGKGSPVIYSTADITVADSMLESTASQGVVVEGHNSVTLNNVTLTADNNTKNSDKSDYYQAVMIYQSMSGDAAEGTAVFIMNGGSLTNKNGDIFFVNNTVADIELDNVKITNEGDGIFLRAAAAGWGNEGSNGGHVTLNVSSQTIDGNMDVDSISTLNLCLKENSVFNGAINSDGNKGEIYVELKDGSKWVLTEDSYISSLTCDENSIDLNGHKLYVDGEEYKEGTSSVGKAIEAEINSGGPGGNPPDGNGGPNGNPPDGNGGPGGTPPDGFSADGNTADQSNNSGGPGGNPPSGNGGPAGTPPDGNGGPGTMKPDGEPPAKPQ